MVNLGLAAVFGKDVCTEMAIILDHFGEDWFAAGETFFQKGLGYGNLFHSL